MTRWFIGVALAVAMLASVPASAATFRTLHAFTGDAGGSSPSAPLVFGRQGALLYGTTAGGPGTARGYGTVFSFNPTTKVLTTLYTFKNGADGTGPIGLVFGPKSAVLYGVASGGGSTNCPGGCGTVFSLDPATRVLTILHTFTGGNDGGNPIAPLIFGPKGDVLYGATESGGGGNSGTIYSINPTTKMLTTLHTFTGGGVFGGFGGLIFGPNHALLYGTTFAGGSTDCGQGGCGTVFSLDPSTKVLSTLYDFSGPDGAYPMAGLLFGPATGYFTAQPKKEAVRVAIAGLSSVSIR
jgi:uncharacterized repeat protein (TIGR03803 family)